MAKMKDTGTGLFTGLIKGPQQTASNSGAVPLVPPPPVVAQPDPNNPPPTFTPPTQTQTQVVAQDPKRNYTKAAHEFEDRYLRNQSKPAKIVGDDVVVEKPDVEVRNTMAQQKALFFADWQERAKNGYHQNVNPLELISDKHYNLVTGEPIVDDTPEGQYFKDAVQSIKPALQPLQERYKAMVSIAHDTNHLDGADWKQPLSKLKETSNVGKIGTKAFAGFATGISDALTNGAAWVGDQLGIYDKDKAAQERGFANWETFQSVEHLNKLDRLSDLGGFVSDAFTKGEAGYNQSLRKLNNNGFRAYLHGMARLDTGLENDELRPILEGLSSDDVVGPDGKVKTENGKIATSDAQKIRDSGTLFNHVVDNMVKMTADLLPGAGLNTGMKVASGLGIGARTYMVESRFAQLARTMGKEALDASAEGLTSRGASWVAKHMSEDLANRVMATAEGQKILNVQRILNRGFVEAPLRAINDAVAFGINSLGKGCSDDELHQAVTTGAIFGFTNGVLGKLGANLAAGNMKILQSLEGLSNADKAIIESGLANKTKFASALSNLIANPVGGAVQRYWQTGDIHKAFDWENGGRELLVDTITGSVFGAHELLSGAHTTTSEHALQIFNARKEYYDQLAERTKAGDLSLGSLADITNTAREKVEKINLEAEAKAPARKIETSEKKEMDDDAAFIFSDALPREADPEHAHILDEAIPPEMAEAPPTAPLPTEPLGSHDFIAGEPVTTQSKDFAERYRIIYGKKFDPNEANLLHVLTVATTPIFEGDGYSQVTHDALSRFIKDVPGDVKINMSSDVRVNGTSRPMAYDPQNNTITINGNYGSYGNLHSFAHVLSEELVHAVTAPVLAKNMEVASKVDADRKDIVRRYLNGEYNGLSVLDPFGNEHSIGNSDYADEAMKYYLGSNEEFVAGAYNGNLPLAGILRNTKLEGQRRFTAFERIADHFSGNGKESIKAYQAHLEEAKKQIGGNEVGSFNFMRSPQETFRQIERAVSNREVAEMDKSNLDKADEKTLMAVYGARRAAQVTAKWGEMLRQNDGANAVVNDVQRQVDTYIERNKITDNTTKTLLAKQMYNRAKSYIQSHSYDKEQTVLAVDENGATRIKNYERGQTPGVAQDNSDLRLSPPKSNGDGMPFKFFAQDHRGLKQTLQSVYDRSKRNGHVRAVQAQILKTLIDAPPASVQYYKSDADLLNRMPDTITSKQAYDDAVKIFRDTGVYMAPRIAGGSRMIDMSNLFHFISDALPTEYDITSARMSKDFANVGRMKADDFCKHVDNLVSYEWLASHDGAGRSDLAKRFGRLIDIGKVLKDPIKETDMASLPDLFERFVYDDIKNNPKLRDSAIEVLKENGLDSKSMYDLRESLMPLWKNQYTGELHPFGGEQMPTWDKLFRAAHLLTTFGTDPSLKAMASKRKEGQLSEITSGKISEKYIGTSWGGANNKTLKNADALRISLGDKHSTLWNEDGSPSVNKWQPYNIRWRLDPATKEWIASENVLVIDPNSIPEKHEAIKAALTEAATDGTTIFVHDPAVSLYNDILGKDGVNSFKNQHSSSDTEHTVLTKTAYHNTPTRSDNPMYAPLVALFDAARAAGCNRIKFSSAIKAGGTYVLKEAKAGLPGLEDEPVFYDNKGLVQDKAIREAAYDRVLTGGAIPEYMIQREDLTGDQGQNFIFASGKSKNDELTLGQFELGHAQPAHPWYQKYATGFNGLRNSLRARREAIERGAAALTSASAVPNAEAGELLRQMHNMAIANLNTSDESMMKFSSPEIVEHLQKSYSIDKDGIAYPTAIGIATAIAYPHLLRKGRDGEPSFVDHIYHDALTSERKMKPFGKMATMIPHFMPGDAIDSMAALHLQEAQRMDPVAGAAKKLELEALHQSIMDKHIDPLTGQWLPDSNGLIVGERKLYEMNEHGRRTYGDAWQPIQMGSKVFGLLIPTDAASSFPALEVIGVVPGGDGVSINPELSKVLGRDFDADKLGIVPNSPDWQGQHEALWDAYDRDNVAFDQSERAIRTTTGEVMSPEQIRKAFSLYNNGNNEGAWLLGAQTDVRGMSPLEGMAYWQKAADADSSQGSMVSKISAYAQFMRAKDKGTPVVFTDENGTKIEMNPDAQQVHAMLSLIKQDGTVDKFTKTPVLWEDLFYKTIIKSIDDKPIQSIAIENPPLFRSVVASVSQAMARTNKTSTSAIAKKAKDTNLGNTATEPIKAAGTYMYNQTVAEAPQHGESYDAYINTIGARAAMGFSKSDLKNLPDIAQKTLFEHQARALLSGLPLNRINKSAKIADIGEGVRLNAAINNGRFFYQIDSKGKSLSYTPRELFDVDGTPSDALNELMHEYDIKPEMFFSDSNDGSLRYGNQPFLEYNTYKNMDDKIYNIGLGIASIAKNADNPGIESGKLISRMLAKVGARSWYDLVDAVRKGGIEPVTTRKVERKVGEAYLLNPSTGEFNPVIRVGNRWMAANSDAPPVEGKIVSTVEKTEGELKKVLHTVQVPESYESAFVGAVRNNLPKAKPTSEDNVGAFDFMKSVKYTPVPFYRGDVMHEIIKDAGEMAGVGEFGNTINNPADQQKYVDALKKAAKEHFGSDVDHNTLESMLDELSPGTAFTNRRLAQETNGNMMPEVWATMQMLGTLKGLKTLALQGMEWKDTQAGAWLMSTSSVKQRNALSLAWAHADRRVTVSDSDVLYSANAYNVSNGIVTPSKKSDVLWKSQVRDLQQFNGTQSVPESMMRYIIPMNRIEDSKRIATALIDRYRESTDQNNVYGLQFLAENGFLTDALPNVKISVDYNDSDHNVAKNILINDKYTDLDEGLTAHYTQLGASKRDIPKLVSGMKSIINTQADAALHGALLSSQSGIFDSMMKTNTDVLKPDEADFGMQHISKTMEKVDHYVGLSPLQAYHKLMSVDSDMASAVLSEVMHRGQYGELFNFYKDEPLTRVNPNEWQNMIKYDIGRQLFGWSEDYASMAKEGQRRSITRTPLLNGRIKFMDDFLMKHYNAVRGTDELPLFINKGFLTAKEQFMQQVESQGSLPEYEASIGVTTGQIISAVRNIVKEKGLNPDDFKSLELRYGSGSFSREMEKNIQEQFAVQSHLSLAGYGRTADTHRLALDNTAWLLSNGFGNQRRYMQPIDEQKFKDSVKDGLLGSKKSFILDSPDLPINTQCLVQHTKADGTQVLAQGRYVGSFSPEALRKTEDGLASMSSTKLYSVFQDPESGATHVISNDRIASIMANNDSYDWNNRLMSKQARAMTDAPEFMKTLAENTHLYIDQMGDEVDFDIAPAARKHLEDIREHGLRNIPLGTSIESTIKKVFTGASSWLYRGKKELAMLTMAPVVATVNPGLGFGVATQALGSIVRKNVVNLFGNLTTGARAQHMFEDGSTALAPFTQLKNAIDDIRNIGSRKSNTDKISLAEATTLQKLQENKEATALQQELGLKGDLKSTLQELNALKIIGRYQQRYNALFDEKYPDMRKDLRSRIASINKNSKDYTQKLNDIYNELSWDAIVAKDMPQDLKELGIAPVVAGDKLKWVGNSMLGSRASAQLENMSAFSKGIFNLGAKLCDTGVQGVEQFGKGLLATAISMRKASLIGNHIFKVMSDTEAVSARGSQEKAEQNYNTMIEDARKAGIDVVDDPVFKHNWILEHAKVTAGQYEKNSLTSGAIGGNLVMFTQFQQGMRNYNYGLHYELKAKFDAVQRLAKENPEFSKFLSDHGFVTGDFTIFNKQKQFNKDHVKALGYKMLGMAISTFASAALYNMLTASGSSEDDAIASARSVKKIGDYVDKGSELLSRATGADNELASILSNTAQSVAYYLPGVLTVQTNTAGDNGAKSGGVQAWESVMNKKNRAEGEITSAGMSPMLGSAFHLGTDLLMNAFMANQEFRHAYADNLANQVHGPEADMASTHARVAVDEKFYMSPWSMSNDIATMIAPGLGTITSSILRNPASPVLKKARKDAKNNN